MESITELSEEFVRDYELFEAEFDELYQKDRFAGEQLDDLTKKFLAKHGAYMKKMPFLPQLEVKQNQSGYYELLDEDLRILSSEQEIVSKPKYAELIANFYRRAASGCHLRITLHKSRLNKEDDRKETVEHSRLAIRYNPDDFHVCFWYMIAMGWYLNSISNPKERTLAARVFKVSAQRCIKMKPEDPLAHQLLGRYFFFVADLNWFERKVAKQFLGEKMEASYDEAEAEILRGHKLQDWLPTGLWMARVLHAKKRPLEEVKHWIDYGLKQPCLEPTTEIERCELLELQAKLKLSN